MAGHVKRPKEDKNTKPIVIKEFPVAELKGDVISVTVDALPDCKAITISPLKNGKFEIIMVEVDSVSKIAGKVTVLDTADSKYEANEKFKLNVVRQGII